MMLYALGSHATKADSTFQRHQISLSLANAMSQTFFDGPNHKPTTIADFTSGIIENSTVIHQSYLPLYAAHLQLHYSLGITPLIRIETGIGYLFSSSILKDNYTISGDWYYEKGSSTSCTFKGSITLPLYVKVIKPMAHGAFTCTAGPDFTLPVHYYIHETDRVVNGLSEKNADQHGKLSTQYTAQTSTMGFYLKLACEKRIGKNMSVNVGPAIDFFQLLQFHNNDLISNDSGYHPYQYYIGLDLAINFGFKK